MRLESSGTEVITDATAKTTLRQTARKIQFVSPMAALILTTIALWAVR